MNEGVSAAAIIRATANSNKDAMPNVSIVGHLATYTTYLAKELLMTYSWPKIKLS